MNKIIQLGTILTMPSISNEIKISDIISIIAFIPIIIGGVFALIQWIKSMRLKRADYLNDIIQKLRTDAVLKECTKYFDYGREWYSFGFHNSEIEEKFDYYFSVLSYICYLKSNRIICRKEFLVFKYEIERAIINRQTQNYFYNLYHFANNNNVPFPFYYLLEYAKKRRVVSKEFFNPKSKLYSHILNF